MRFDSKLVAAGLSSAVATTWTTDAIGDSDNNEYSFKAINIENVVLSPANEKAVLFTSNGATYTVDQGADCQTSGGTDGKIDLDGEQIRRRKTHTRIQHEVEFWVPKTMAVGIPQAGSAWTAGNGGTGYVTCVIYAASDVAMFEWVNAQAVNGRAGSNNIMIDGGAESVPVITNLDTQYEATRVMCGNKGTRGADHLTTFNNWELPDSFMDAEFFLPRNTVSGHEPDARLIGNNVKTKGIDCNGDYAMFGMEDAICAVTEWQDTGYMFCMVASKIERNSKMSFATIARDTDVDATYYPFTDATAASDAARDIRGAKGVLAADGSENLLCRADDNTKPDIKCIYTNKDDGWHNLGNQPNGHNIGEENRASQVGYSSNCTLAQVNVVIRDGAFVVYGLCKEDGSVICAGGISLGMKAKDDSGCGLERTLPANEGSLDKLATDNYYRFNVNGYFMEPDQNAHKGHTTVNGGSKFFSTRTSAAGVDDNGTSQDSTDDLVIPAEAHFVDHDSSKTAGLYDGTMFDITASMTGEESVVCLKNSKTVLAMQTKSGRLLVNSENMTFPYKYGVVFLTAPLQTMKHQVPALPYPSPTPIGDDDYLGDQLDLNNGANNTDAGAAAWFNAGLPSGREQAGYDDYKDANVTEPGSFYQVMMKDMTNTDMPQLVRSFAINASEASQAVTGSSGDTLWVTGNLGHSKITMLDNQWEDTPWLAGAKGSASGAALGTQDDTGAQYDSWNQAAGADTDSVAECGFELKNGAVNLTFCLSSVGICSFHVSPNDGDALRHNSSTDLATYPGADTAPVGYSKTQAAAATNPSESAVNHAWKPGHFEDDNGVVYGQAMSPTLDTAVVQGQCLSLYSYNKGCVLLTGIDDTNENHRNNDYFDCNVVVLVMNYSTCVLGQDPIYNNSPRNALPNDWDLPDQNKNFSVTYGDTVGSEELAKDFGSDPTKVMYMANTMRMREESHLFQADSIDKMGAENIELRCTCVYDIEQQVAAGILAASGSLGSATQNEITTQFDVCITIINAASTANISKFGTEHNYYQVAKDLDGFKKGADEKYIDNADLVLSKCSQDPKKYGEGLATGTVAGTSYTILIAQDSRSLPDGVSFMTDAFIFPSNHANDKRTNHVGGTSGSPDLINWEEGKQPDGTGIVKGNCGAPGHANWGAGNKTSIVHASNLGSRATDNTLSGDANPVISRGNLGYDGTGNTSMSSFGLNLNTTAWLGYSYNLFYVRTTRCSVGTLHCVKCDLSRRRMLEEKSPNGGASRNGGEQFTLLMKNPKYIMDPAAVRGNFNEQAAYDPFSSAVAVALFGLVSMLF